jgi:adenylate cyclase
MSLHTNGMTSKPTPPPKQTKFGFAHKPSFSSFAPRQGSVSNLSLRARPSESHSLADSFSSINTQSVSEFPHPGNDSKKSKSNFSIIPRIIKKRSRSRLLADPDRPNGSFSSPAPPVPYLNPSASFTSTSFYPLSTSPPPSSKRGKAKGKQKAGSVPPPLPYKDPREPELTLDTNLEEMDGIVDLTPRLSSSNDPVSSSPSSGLDSPVPSSSFSFGDFNPNSTSPTTSMFSNPFPLTPAKNPQQLHRHVHVMLEKVSPKTQAPPVVLAVPAPMDGLASSAASWEAPQSWAVEKDGEDPAEPPDYSSSEDSVAIGHHAPKKHRSHRTSTRPKPPPKAAKPCMTNKPFKVRIYRANNTYHVASIGLSVTVADLAPVLNTKLLLESERETHRLYLKERGRGAYPGVISSASS